MLRLRLSAGLEFHQGSKTCAHPMTMNGDIKPSLLSEKVDH